MSGLNLQNIDRGNVEWQSGHLGLPPSIPLKIESYVRPRPYTGPSADYVLQQRREHLSSGQYHFYDKPLMLVEAQNQYAFDDKGNSYIDAYSNVCHVGHCHPAFVRAIAASAGEILSNTRYLHPNIVEYVKRLKNIMPRASTTNSGGDRELSVVWLVNSGSEANDLAMRLARCYTQRNTMACLEGAYHGTTSSCAGVSTSLSVGSVTGSTDFEYASRDTVVLPAPDTYRGKFRGDDPQCGEKYAAWGREVVEQSGKARDVAGVIVEAIQGVGGQRVWPKNYLKNLFEYVRGIGGVAIVDEVQTGFKRMGTKWWACELQDVVPDILTLGKPIGNGVPLAAVVTTREIAAAFAGTKYFNTFGGSPLPCAAGLAVLSIIERDNLGQNAERVGAFLIREFQRLQQKHSMIGDVRGAGLFIGVELVRDRETQEPADEETKHVMEEMKTRGVLIGTGGILGNVLRFKPPLCVTVENAKTIAAALDDVLTEMPAKFRLKAQRDKERANAPQYVYAGAPASTTPRPSRRGDHVGGIFSSPNADGPSYQQSGINVVGHNVRTFNTNLVRGYKSTGGQHDIQQRGGANVPFPRRSFNDRDADDGFDEEKLRSPRQQKLLSFDDEDNNTTRRASAAAVIHQRTSSAPSRVSGGGGASSSLRALVEQSLRDTDTVRPVAAAMGASSALRRGGSVAFATPQYANHSERRRVRNEADSDDERDGVFTSGASALRNSAFRLPK